MDTYDLTWFSFIQVQQLEFKTSFWSTKNMHLLHWEKKSADQNQLRLGAGIFRCKNVILNTCCLNYNCHMKYLQLSQWKMTATQGSRHHTCPSIVVCCCQFSAHGSEQMLLNCGCSRAGGGLPRAGVWLPSCIPHWILTYRSIIFWHSAQQYPV